MYREPPTSFPTLDIPRRPMLASYNNQPKELATYDALSELACNLVDPITEKFGPIKITYGFAGAELTRRIPGRISPKHDQHASCEKNRSGHYICPRKGAAIDFKIENKSSLVIAKWVVMHTPFDRLYFMGLSDLFILALDPTFSPGCHVSAYAFTWPVRPNRSPWRNFYQANYYKRPTSGDEVCRE